MKNAVIKATLVAAIAATSFAAPSIASAKGHGHGRGNAPAHADFDRGHHDNGRHLGQRRHDHYTRDFDNRDAGDVAADAAAGAVSGAIRGF